MVHIHPYVRKFPFLVLEHGHHPGKTNGRKINHIIFPSLLDHCFLLIVSLLSFFFFFPGITIKVSVVPNKLHLILLGLSETHSRNAMKKKRSLTAANSVHHDQIANRKKGNLVQTDMDIIGDYGWTWWH